MKIIHFTSGYEFGGGSLAVKTLHEGLLAHGVDSQVISHKLTGWYTGVKRFQSRLGHLSRFCRTVSQCGVRRSWHREAVNATSPYDVLQYFDEPLSEEVASSSPNADIYHIHWTGGFVSGFRMLPILTRRGHVVWTFHDMEPMTGGCSYSKGCEHFFQRCGDCHFLKNRSQNDLSRKNWEKKWRCLQQADKSRIHIHVASRWMEEQVKFASLWRGVPVTLIPFKIDTGVFHNRNRREAKLALGLNASAITLLFAAVRIDNPIKGFATLRKALELLPQKDGFHLLLVGSAVGVDLSSLPLPATHYHAIGNPHLMNLIMRASEIFAMPSQWETFGLTASEAAASGCLCLLSNTSGLRDAAEVWQNVRLLPPDDASAWASALVSARDFVKQCASQSGVAVSDSDRRGHSLGSYIEKFKNFYQGILAGNA
jgi:glycosyltransferase involved in cell wall biosynthesis